MWYFKSSHVASVVPRFFSVLQVIIAPKVTRAFDVKRTGVWPLRSGVINFRLTGIVKRRKRRLVNFERIRKLNIWRWLKIEIRYKVGNQFPSIATFFFTSHNIPHPPPPLPPPPTLPTTSLKARGLRDWTFLMRNRGQMRSRVNSDLTVLQFMRWLSMTSYFNTPSPHANWPPLPCIISHKLSFKCDHFRCKGIKIIFGCWLIIWYW